MLRITILALACSLFARVHAASPLERPDWRTIDQVHAYQGTLGPVLNPDGSATLILWSPFAARVSVVLYDRLDQDRVVADDIPMARHEHGTWTVVLSKENTGVSQLRGYFYHYKIDARGDGKTRLALDPYAKSMAAFDNNRYGIGKAALVDPTAIGPRLDYADIPGFGQREDAIIWEAHVRDLTVDPGIEPMLHAPFGTYTAMIDVLDYLKSLGVTHVQLLPVMSYHWGNESGSRTRELTYSAQDNNYNWGYDPHSYFSLSGMYSDDPANPERRIDEFKALVSAIHERRMGVILDVVYNHTANVRILEDLAPGYYHFQEADGTPKTSFGGGRLGTTHAMARRLMVDSIAYWTREFKVDGFRFDMMGDHDAESIRLAHEAAQALNPNILMIGEGWRTYSGDAGDPRQAADQDWMVHTDAVSVFSDDFRDEIKSGYGSEGQPRFITGGARSVRRIFANICAQPGNFITDDPGDVVPYIEAHDNLTLHDVIAYSAKLDPELPAGEREIQQRIRLGNTLLLTSQGVAFLHAGQEYGRTKQWLAPGRPEHKETYMVDRAGSPFLHPYFVHDSFDASDAINMFDWAKATDAEAHPDASVTRRYTSGLIALRRSTDAFRLGKRDRINARVKLLDVPEIQPEDTAIAYSATAMTGETYFVFINASAVPRRFTLSVDLTQETVVADDDEAGIEAVRRPSGFTQARDSIVLDPLAVVILRQGAAPRAP